MIENSIYTEFLTAPINSKLLQLITVKALSFPYGGTTVDDCRKITDNKSCHDDICFQCCFVTVHTPL